MNTSFLIIGHTSTGVHNIGVRFNATDNMHKMNYFTSNLTHSSDC